MTHDRSDWNTCTKSTGLQGLNNYYTLWTFQGWSLSYCRVLLLKSWEPSKSTTLPKIQNISTVTLSVTQPSAAVLRYSTSTADSKIPIVTRRSSLTETFVQNLLIARAKSFLHTSKQ